MSSEVFDRAMVARPVASLTAIWQWTVVPVMRIEVLIYMPAKVRWPVKPGARTDKYAAMEPFRPVIPIGSARIGRVIEVAVGTNRSRSDVN